MESGVVANLELLSLAGAAVGALLYGVGIWRRRAQAALYGPLSFVLATVGLSMASKVYDLAVERYGLSPFEPLAHFLVGAICLVPISIALFVEKLLGRHLHVVAKLALLGGTLGFVITSLIPGWYLSAAWQLSLAVYVAATLVYLLVLIVAAWWRSAPGPRRSLYGAMALVAFVAPAFVLADEAGFFGLSLPRLSGVPALLLLYYGSFALHSSGPWRLLDATTGLLRAAALLAAGAALVGFAADLSAPAVLAGACALFVGFLALSPTRQLWFEGDSTRAELLLERLGALSFDSLESLVERVGKWPEVERLERVELGGFTEAERESVARFFETHGRVVERAQLHRDFLLADDEARRRRLEQMRFILERYEFDYVAHLGNGRPLLGMSVHYGVDTETYRRVMAVIAVVAARLPD